MDNTLIGPTTMNAPWSLDSRIKLALAAMRFFSFEGGYEERCRLASKPVPSGALVPFTVTDFLTYVKAKGMFEKSPNLARVSQLLDRLVACGLLIRLGGDEAARGNPLGDWYLYVGLHSKPRNEGVLALASALGPDLLYRACSAGLVHITGVNKHGEEVSGTGTVIDESHIVTCGHVLRDMTVSREQMFQGRKYEVDDECVYTHEQDDVGVLRVRGHSLGRIPGLVFRPAMVGETVYALGYPKLPFMRDASVVMQRGTVTTEQVSSFQGEKLFLYSAISRPGNSGGPIMSDDGYLVGIASTDMTAEYGNNKEEQAFSPHYAAVPAQVVARAIDDLAVGLRVPLHDLE